MEANPSTHCAELGQLGSYLLWVHVVGWAFDGITDVFVACLLDFLSYPKGSVETQGDDVCLDTIMPTDRPSTDAITVAAPSVTS